MPRAIAIETSGRVGSIATFDSARGGVIAEKTFPHGLQHAAQLLVILDELVRAAGWTPRDVENVYVSIGPGSFTGLRIATTLAKTLWFSTAAKIAAVPSVRVLAENAPPDATNIAIVIDAKRGQIFTASFARSPDSGLIETQPARVDTLANVIATSPRPLHLIGEGIPYHADTIPKDDPAVIVTPPESWRGRASVVATLGAQAAARGEFADALKLTPIYIRLAEAEEKWRAANTEAPTK